MEYIAALGWCIAVAIILVASINRGLIGHVVGAIFSAPPFFMAVSAIIGSIPYVFAVPAWIVAIALCSWLATNRTPASVDIARTQFAYRTTARKQARRRVMVQTTEGIK